MEDLQVRPLQHGYTNHTIGDATSVIKTYQGPDTMLRRDREHRALRHLRGRVPVPELYASEPGSLTLEFLPGTHGQELIDQGYAAQVLRACGEQLRALHAVSIAGFELATAPAENTTQNNDSHATEPAPEAEPAVTVPALEPVLVHGDFGPNNTLLDPATFAVTALLDWEFAHIGAPLEDLSWCEWIIRAHHPTDRDALAEFFLGYGGPAPTWSDRQAAMVARCDELRLFCRRWNPYGPGERQWAERMSAASAWRE